MAAATMYVTPAGALGKTGANWANAMGLAEWTTDMVYSAEPGDTYFVAGGTYTLTADSSSALDGSAALTINIIGVKSTTTNEPPVYADWAFGADRPTIALGAYNFDVDDYWVYRNLIFTVTDNDTPRGDYSWTVINCKSTNSSGTGGREGFFGYSGSQKFIQVEAVSTNGVAINGYSNTLIYACYVHDSSTGLNLAAADNFSVISNVIDTCTTGIDFSDEHSHFVINNTIYNCTTGINANTSNTSVIYNNIIDSCTTGASQTSELKSTIFDYNCWNNTTDVSNVTKGPNDITDNPDLNAPADGDFTLKAGSPCIDTGLKPPTATT